MLQGDRRALEYLDAHDAPLALIDSVPGRGGMFHLQNLCRMGYCITEWKTLRLGMRHSRVVLTYRITESGREALQAKEVGGHQQEAGPQGGPVPRSVGH